MLQKKVYIYACMERDKIANCKQLLKHLNVFALSCFQLLCNIEKSHIKIGKERWNNLTIKIHIDNCGL